MWELGHVRHFDSACLSRWGMRLLPWHSRTISQPRDVLLSWSSTCLIMATPPPPPPMARPTKTFAGKRPSLAPRPLPPPQQVDEDAGKKCLYSRNLSYAFCKRILLGGRYHPVHLVFSFFYPPSVLTVTLYISSSLFHPQLLPRCNFSSSSVIFFIHFIVHGERCILLFFYYFFLSS